MVLQTLPFVNGKFYGKKQQCRLIYYNRVDNSLLPLSEFTDDASQIHSYLSDYIFRLQLDRQTLKK